MVDSTTVAQKAICAVTPSCRSLDFASAGRLAVAALSGAAALPSSQQLGAILNLAPHQHASGLPRLSGNASAIAASRHSEPEPGRLWVLAAAAATLLTQQRASEHPSYRREHARDAVVHLMLPALEAEAASPARMPAAAMPQAVTAVARGAAKEAAGEAAAALGGQSGRLEELLQAVVDIFTAYGCWDLGLTIVQASTAPQAQQQRHEAQMQPGLMQPQAVNQTSAEAEQLRRLLPGLRLRLAAAVIRQALLADSRQACPGQRQGNKQEGRQLEQGWLALPVQGANLSATGETPGAAAQMDAVEQQGWEAIVQHAVRHTLPELIALLLAQAQPPEGQQQMQRFKQHRHKQQAAEPAHARAATQQLLLAVLAAAAQLGEHQAAVQQLRDACKKLLGAPGVKRRLGLALLLQLPAALLVQVVGGPEAMSGGTSMKDAREHSNTEEEQGCTLWRPLRSCLCDGEAANRKRAAHVLRLTLQQQAPDGQLGQEWHSFFKLLECLDERAPHLVKDGWQEIERLHPREPAAGASAGHAGSTASSTGLGWAWMEVLWARSLQHEHQQVQRGVLESFVTGCWLPQQRPPRQPLTQQPCMLQTEQDPQHQMQQQAVQQGQALADVPVSFVLEVVLPAAGQAHMWRGEGAAALQERTTAWVGWYAAAALGQQERRQLLLSLLGLLAGNAAGSQAKPRQQQLVLRPLVQTVLAALVRVACVSAAAVEAFQAGGRTWAEEEQKQKWEVVFLQGLQRATANLNSSWGPLGGTGSHTTGVCGSLLQAAAASVPLTATSCSTGAGGDMKHNRALLLEIGSWLQQLPLPLLLPDGALHLPAASWLQAGRQQGLLPVLGDCVADFVAPPLLGLDTDTGSPVSASEWAAWERQSGNLAKLVLLLSSGTCLSNSTSIRPLTHPSDGASHTMAQQSAASGVPPRVDLAQALSAWAVNLRTLHRRPYLRRGTAERCLLLLSHLLNICSPLLADAAAEQQHMQQKQPLAHLPRQQQQERQELTPEGPQQSAKAQQPLVVCVAATLQSAAYELVSYAKMVAAASLWIPPQQAPQQKQQQQQQLLHTQQHQQQQPDGGKEDIRLAHLSLACISGTLSMLSSLQHGQWQLEDGGAAGQAAEQLKQCCQKAVRCFVAACEGHSEGQQHVHLTPACMAEWEHAAAQLATLTECCRSLTTAAKAEQDHECSSIQATARLTEQEQQIRAALDAVLHLQGTAAAAACNSGTGSTAGSDGHFAAAAAYCHRLCWKAAVGLLELQQELHAQQGQQQQKQQQQLQQQGLEFSHQQQQWEEQQAHLLAAALCSLEADAGAIGPAADHRRLLLQLHCCRLLLHVALDQPRVLGLLLDRRLLLAPQQADGLQSAPTINGDEGSAAALVGWLCAAAWRAYQAGSARSSRRRTGLTAALVATCLHPALFDTAAGPSRLELHAPGGPLQQLLRHLMAAGARSWRIISVVALQLCGLLSRHAGLAGQYSDLLQELLLWGSTEEPGQSGVGDPVDGETAAELAALLAPGDAELAAAFGATELAPRVAALCMLQSWVQQAGVAAAFDAKAGTTGGDGSDSATSARDTAAAAAAEAGLVMWRQLLALSSADPELGAGRCSELGKVHRKKVRLWQALCVLSPLVPAEQAEHDFEVVLCALSRADLANVKQYQDTVALVLLRRCPHLLRVRVLPLLRDCSSSGSHALSSLIIIAARAVVADVQPTSVEPTQQPPQQQEQLLKLDEQQASVLTEVVGSITPWTLSHVHALRTFAQLILWRLYQLFPSLVTADATAASLLHFFRENQDVNRLKRGLSHAFQFDSFDLDQAVTPAGMLCKGTSVHRADVAFEGAPQTLLEEVQAFLLVERQHLRQDLRQSKAAAVTAKLAARTQPDQRPQLPNGSSSCSTNWQKKGGSGGGRPAGIPARSSAWAAVLGTSALLSGGMDGTELELAAAEEAVPATGGSRPRQELLVVASLLSRAANLAGLARTCEVFRASGLVLPDLSVTQQPEFRSIAVTAHQWLPLMEVPEAALGAWLQRQAAQGWTLVGLEQTAESVPLQEFQFPPRTVLVLGREKEGVPADLLGIMHHTVEIPQLGIIRSLNVHVSGALAVFEYTRQHALGAAATAVR